jgi:tRNA pseudouridine55 synthase
VARSDRGGPSGLVVVDKPAGMTSHDVVARCRRAFSTRRVGHAGTLDPDATGVLLVAVGMATRLVQFLQGATKTYDARAVFGIATDTLDLAGTVLESAPMPVSESEVRSALVGFMGEIDQIPPMVSAIKVGGVRLHELARRGDEVERAPRRVRIDRFELTGFEAGEQPRADFVIDCGSGTYVRSLVADLGTALGGRAALASLRRTRVGSFTIDDAHPLGEVEARNVELMLTPANAIAHLPVVTADDPTAMAVGHGAKIEARLWFGDARAPELFAVHDDNGTLLAVYQAHTNGTVKPVVVLAP